MKPLSDAVFESYEIEEGVPSSWSSYVGKKITLKLGNGSESRGKLLKIGRNKKGQQTLIFSAGKGAKRYVAVKDIKSVKKK
jgi:hypothetical protein